MARTDPEEPHDPAHQAAPSDLAMIESRRDLLERLGIEAGVFGADRIAVHAFPTLLRDTDVPA